MGEYSVLTIDRFGSAWKYEVPAFLAFLFADEDFCSKIPDDPENPDQGASWMGYRTTAGTARQRLNNIGFTVGFFGGILEMLGEDVDASLIGSLVEHDCGDGNCYWYTRSPEDVRQLIREAATRPAVEQIATFADVLRSDLSAATPPAYVEAFRFRNSGHLFIDPWELPAALLHRHGQVDAGALRVSELFAELTNCPREISELLLARVLVEIVASDAEVNLDLSDFYDGHDLRGEPSRLAISLVRRVQLYNRAFGVLVENQADVRREAVLVGVDQTLRDLPKAETNDDKGRLLENLIASIFEGTPGFVVAHRRYNLGDQEIDLVIRNHVNDPFWTALQTPIILVECKNWSSRVGASELRNFETKLRDHSEARLGIFVAINGFSEKVDDALLRASRENYRLLPITGTELQSLVEERLEVVEWLTRRLSALQ